MKKRILQTIAIIAIMAAAWATVAKEEEDDGIEKATIYFCENARIEHVLYKNNIEGIIGRDGADFIFDVGRTEKVKGYENFISKDIDEAISISANNSVIVYGNKYTGKRQIFVGCFLEKVK